MSDVKDANTQTESVDYMTVPLERLDVTDLTDAIGVAESAKLLGTSDRAIYTVRNTKSISVERMQALINEIEKNETHYRQRLTILRNNQAAREAKKLAAA